MNIICKIADHKIQPTGPCEGICVRCGYRNTFHRFNGCKCETCGKPGPDHHAFAFVSRESVYGKCLIPGAFDHYSCIYCTEECSHRKFGEKVNFKCKTCGTNMSMDSDEYDKYLLTENNRKANKKVGSYGGNSYEIVW